jgi:uncharacterized membrane protein/Mg-chelatase subunit ChlD
MFSHSLGFDASWFLLLLLLIPVLWIVSFKPLSGLGTYRRILAIGLRTLCLILLVFALAEAQYQRSTDKMTVIYLLDQSRSIPAAQRHSMLKYVVKSVAEHRQPERHDEAGVIVFGREAVIEIPPFDDSIRATTIESGIDLRTDATNLAAALKLAHASFPEDTAKRIVIVSDGNENLGDARAILPLLADEGIGIDVVPIHLNTRAEIIVEKVTLPSDIRKGQTIDAHVVITNHSQKISGEDDGVVRGKLRITRTVGRNTEVLGDGDKIIDLAPGKQVFTIRDTIEHPNLYTYKAEFIPLEEGDDLMQENNVATSFTHVRGKGRILFIENWENPGDFAPLIERLQDNNIEVVLQTTDQLFGSLAELQEFDSIVMADVPRASGEDIDKITSFTDDQIRMLVRNTEQMGCGIVMLGGPNSFGAGGWAGSELEKAMPVDFQIKNAKARAIGALVILMHASEMPQGNHWQKVIAMESLKILGPADYCGIVHWDDFGGGEDWLWGKGKPSGLVQVGSSRRMMIAQMGKMRPGDMPDFDPGLLLAYNGFAMLDKQVKAMKHMIVISDGDPSPPSANTIPKFVKMGVKISTVAVGTHGGIGNNQMQTIATATGGKFYQVTNPRALPRIFQLETRKVARPLIKENINISPVALAQHEIINGIDSQFPPITGYVQTELKESSFVEKILELPGPDGKINTVLAAWHHGAGRTVAFTTDTGRRWAGTWPQWSEYDKLFTQMIRWSMRPIDDSGKFSVATDMKDGKVRVIITALDKEDEYLNFINMSATVVDPNLENPSQLEIKQISAGRYFAEFEADQSGSYFVNITPGQETDENGKVRNRAPIIAGINVPYSAEFRERDANLTLLKSFVQQKPDGGEPGELIESSEQAISTFDDASIDVMLGKTNVFRHNLSRARSSQDVWPLFVFMASCLFLADVAVRRVHMGFDWLWSCLAWVGEKIFGRQREEQPDERMSRLRSRKEQIAESIDGRRAATRFAPEISDDQPPRSLEEVLGDNVSSTDRPPSSAGPSQAVAPDEEESYTSRLFQAKKKAWKDKNSDNN